ncbi:T9SS type B sorting domain-containing protein [Flavobacterium praedii]|uniref:T9SS type B sorting domain-containing protein n=1 Tax=Flavobacterium praedii TaxID=3002900 RepID=UPI002481E4A5|nr:T9SS type B sorting domain-containing protein [Flavobacterium praedii]
MQNFTLQSLFAPKKRLLLLVFLCFITFTFSNAQNLLSSNNPSFEGIGGFQTDNAYIDITASISGSSSNGNYALIADSGPMNTSSFNAIPPHSGAKMMVIDALSSTNSKIFWQQNPNIKLEGGVTYTFSYWVVNINKNGTSNSAFPNPVIVFSALDQCICTPVLKSGSATVNSATWQKVVYEFTPSGTGAKWVRIELSLPSATPNGNDFAIDDISLYAPPPPLTISTSLTNPSCPTGNDGVIVAYPNGGVGPFTFTLSGAVSATNSTGIFQNLAGGTYSVAVTDSNSPASSVSTPAILIAPSDITLNASPTGCLLSGATVTLTAANGGATYSWSASPGGAIVGTGNSIVVTPTTPTTYTVNSTTVPPSVGNLIGNPGFENGTSGFYSDYGYSLTNTSGTQFAYGIVSNPSTWYNKFTTCGDKTTGSGNMLVADGATIANSVIWSQTVPVETSKSYTFSFWVQNIGDGSKATFDVLINGSPVTISPISATNNVIAGTPATTTCNWTNITGTWNSSAATLATIKIIDSNISSGGNDFAIDDISFSTTSSKTCSLSTSTIVSIGGSAPVIGFSYPTPVCKNGTNPLPTLASGFVTGGTFSSTAGLVINATTGAIDLATSAVGAYTVTYAVAANAAICQLAGSSTATITINPVPSILTTPGGNLCGSGIVSMSATATAGSTINWYTATTGAAFTTGNTVNTPTSISTSTNYYIDATLNGCTSTPRAMVTAIVNPIPTILTTPGGSSCGAGVVTMTATATAGSTINWYTATTGASFGTGNSINTPTSLSTTTTYYVDATLNGCTTATRVPIVATVNPPLTFSCGTQTNTSVTFDWTAVVGATSYDYTYTKSSGGAAITGNTTANSLNVTGLLPSESITISVKPIGSPCSIFVGPFTCAASACNTPTTNQIVDIKKCANAIIPIQTFTSPLATASFKWTNDNTAIGLAASGTNNLPSFTTANVTTAQIAKITVNAIDPLPPNCTGPDMVFYITVNPLPTVTVNSPAVCAGTSATVIATPGDSGTYNYAWTSSVSAPSNVASFSTTVAENYSVVITNPLTTCFSSSASGAVTINPLPTVTVNTLPVCFGNSATVTAIPGIVGTYNYTWSVPSGASLPGNVASFSTTVAGPYNVIISDANCSSAIASKTVVIYPLPTVTVNNPTVCAGSSAIVTATPGASGTYNYVWTVPITAPAQGNIASFSTTVAGNYSVIITDPTTTCSSASALGTVTVTPLPTMILSSLPATTSQSLCINTAITPISYTVGGSATGASVTALPTGVTGSFSSGVFTISGIPTVAGTFNYTVATTGGCTPAVSLFGTITVSPLSTLTLTTVASTTNQVFCLNSTLNTITYAVGGSATGAVINGLPAGVTGSFAGGVVTISGTPTVSGLFNYKVTTTGGCSPTVILGGTIKINPLSTMILSSASTTTNQTICSNDSITPIVYTVGGSAIGATVTGLPAGITGTFVSGIFTISGTPTLPGTFNYRVTTTGGCNPAIVMLGTITVNSLPIASYTGITSLCSGNVTSIALSSTIPGSTFSWNAVQNNVSGASSSTGNTIAQTLSTTGTNVGQVVYNVTPIAGSCLGLPKMITIDVSPVPNVVDNTAKKIVCSGETTNIKLSSGIVGTTFSWTVNATGVTGATVGSGNTITQTLSNLGFVPGTVDYTITPSINGCIGTPIVVTITVNPLPEVLGTPPGTICSGYNTNVVLSPTISGTTFDWTVLQVGVTGAIAGTGNTINQILEATGNSQGNVTYTITPSLNGCIGIPLDIIVNVNPSPKPSLVGGVICVEQATGIAFKTHTLDSGLSASNYNFVWYLNAIPIIGANSNTYDAVQSGDYKVQATNNLTGCDATSETVKVTDSFPGLAMSTTQTLAFSDNAMVTVSVTGGNAAYEYQLDNGSFQSSNVFENLKPGPHSVTVGDENGCTNLTQSFFVIGYPKFFSPNGDGHNDFWNVVGLDGQPASVIYIFDRYGKLLKQIYPTSDGWDGFYIGAEMPATDYWFTIEYTEQSEIKLFKSHFSLIR